MTTNAPVSNSSANFNSSTIASSYDDVNTTTALPLSTSMIFHTVLNTTNTTSALLPTIGMTEDKIIDTCSAFNVDLPNNIGLSVVFGISFMLGIFFAVFGYRVFRAACFTHFFGLFGTITHILLLEFTALSMVYNGIISGVVGALFGSAAAIIIPIGIISLSLVQSLLVTGIIVTVVDVFTKIVSFWIPVGLLIGLFIIFAGLCFMYQRPSMILFITSFSGLLIALSVDFYLNKMNLATFIYHKLQGKSSSSLCWHSYAIFGIWFVVTVIGCVVQFLKTSKGFHHKGEGSPNLGKKKSPSLHRGLYYNGDIIAQAWIQDTEDTLEKRSSLMVPYEDQGYLDPGESTTLV